MKNILKYMLTGLLMGSFFFLAVALFLGPDLVVTTENILINWLMSGLIGIVSLIYDQSGDPYLKIGIHYVLVSIIVNVTALSSQWISVQGRSITFLNITIFVIYVLIWVILYLIDMMNIKKINQRLDQKNQH